MAARAGVEPTTLRLKAIDSTKAPPCPTYASKMEETGFSYGCYLIFQRESITENTKVTENICWFNGTVWPRLRTVWGISVVGVRRRLNQISSVLEALSFRCINAHHACISVKQASET